MPDEALFFALSQFSELTPLPRQLIFRLSYLFESSPWVVAVRLIKDLKKLPNVMVGFWKLESTLDNSRASAKVKSAVVPDFLSRYRRNLIYKAVNHLIYRTFQEQESQEETITVGTLRLRVETAPYLNHPWAVSIIIVEQ